MARPLVHPRLLASLGNFYSSLCTIQEATEVRDEYGQSIAGWANKAGHVDIPCGIAPADAIRNAEVRRPDQTYTLATHLVALQGRYPSITTKMRALVDGKAYDVVAVEADSAGVSTRLKVQVIT
jgi:head-tail adaptor